ncbi:hypothetical protein [Achromobacter sp. E1]|uniref:hypothetical protein n=1 Tax=Achromobacter sp. E1 TaxID=3141581 RepID=UPI0030D0253B
MNRNSLLAAALRASDNRPSPKVVQLLSQTRLVVNRGSNDGIREGQHVIVYAMGDELFDPDSKESLGQVELIKGKAKVVHLQDKIATVENLERTKRDSFNLLGPTTQEVVTPFHNAEVGDLVRFL